MAKKRILKSFEIDEISVVDKPAVADARFTLMKRHEPDKEHQMDIQKIASYATFPEAVAAIAKAEGIPRSAAMQKCAREYPHLLKRYNEEGELRLAKAVQAAKPRPINKAVLEFDDLIDDLAKRHKLPRHMAMKRARQRHPAEFAAAYGRES